MCLCSFFFFFSSRRRHTRCLSDWSSDVCSSDLSGGSRVTSRERFVRGWEEGFATGPARMLGIAGGGYRGLLGAREWLYGRGVLRSEERRVGKGGRSGRSWESGNRRQAE